MRIQVLGTIFGAVSIALLASGCSTMVEQRGNLPDQEKVAQITPGVSTKEAVIQLIGTPSSVGTFDDSTWYYISKRTEQWAFLSPETLDQQVVIVDFDQDGVVKDVRHHGLEDRREIQPVARATPTPGREMSFLEQLFGNLGRFNTRDDRNSNTRPGEYPGT